MNVTVYTTPTCHYCHQVKQFLSQRGIKFTEHDVSVDRAAAAEMVSKSGQMGVPVITVGNQVIIGFDRARLEHLLASNSNGPHHHLGIQIADANKTAPKFGLAPIAGALVGKIAPSSRGEKAGLRQGDIITLVNSRPIQNADDLEDALSASTTGSRAAIVILRGQRTLKFEIIF